MTHTIASPARALAARLSLTALTVLTVLTAACGGTTPAGPPPAMPPTPVTLGTAATSPIADSTDYVATLKSLRSTAIQPQIDGQVTQIFVQAGQRVAAGAPIVQIDPRRQQAAVSSQEAERASREANLAFARQQQQRAKELFAAGAISQQEQEQADTAVRTAQADLEALQAQVQQQQVQLRYLTVAAPTAGVIGDVPVRVGNQVTPSTILTTIDQNETLEVNAQVPIERAGDLKNGLVMQILGSASDDVLATSAVTFISPRVDDQTQSILVKGTVRNPDGRLRAAQYVRARIVWKTADGLLIPVTAVTRVNGQFFAFVAEDAKGGLVAKQRPIKVGPIAGDSYQVLEGLKAGDRIVTSGVQKLADGVPIAPMAPAAPGTPAAPAAPGTK